MRPADDPGVNYRDFVRDGYDRCGEAYARVRRREVHEELELVTERLEDAARVLDLGCGAGVPIASALAERYEVTGVDFSPVQIRLARREVPRARFIEGDALTVELEPGSFDAIVCFYMIFHVPREEQPTLLRRIYDWLRPGGYLLASVARVSESGYIEDDFFGTPMYWSNFSHREYRELLDEIGFEVLDTRTLGHGYGDAYRGRVERHPVVFARRRA